VSSPPEPNRAELRRPRRRRSKLRARILVTGLVSALLLGVMLAAQLYRTAFVGLPDVPDKATLWSLRRPPGFTFSTAPAR
jgi:hypothetical protein